jgi:predicted dehydrogenase
MSKKIRVGFVGANRSCGFLTAFHCNPLTEVGAVCDLDGDKAKETARQYEAAVFTDYEAMLGQGRIDAVVIATPMHVHAPQAIAALDRGIHVMSEVPATVSVEESKALVRAAGKSKAIYMMAENYCYMRPNVQVRGMVRAGVLGDIYYAEGEYIHELKELNEKTKWRRKWQTGINGCTYGTHSLGPILQWFAGQRVVSVSCVGSGHHYKDPRGAEYENEESILMLCRLSGGGLVKIRVDMLSERPHAMTNYSVQGTSGAYESARAEGEKNRVWVKGVSKVKDEWDRLEDYEEKYLPEYWKNPPEEAKQAGHGGGDYFEVVDFVAAVLGKAKCPIDIHQAMDMTLPGLVSQESIQAGGIWLEVPDSRGWR